MSEIFKPEKPRDPEIQKMMDICIQLGVDEEDMNSMVNDCEEDYEIRGVLTQLVVEQMELTDEEFEEILKKKDIFE